MIGPKERVPEETPPDDRAQPPISRRAEDYFLIGEKFLLGLFLTVAGRG